jgi:hypothetical protein
VAYQGDDLQEAPKGEHDSEQHGGGVVDAQLVICGGWFSAIAVLTLEIEFVVRSENPVETGTWLGDFQLGARLLIRGNHKHSEILLPAQPKGDWFPSSGLSPTSIVRPVPP